MDCRQTIERVLAVAGDQPLATSTVVLTELLHGVYRANTLERQALRSAFVTELTRNVRVFPYTEEIARLAGRVGGEQAALGNTIDLRDLMIGVTALSVGYAVLTANERHFRSIPGLEVIAF